MRQAKPTRSKFNFGLRSTTIAYSRDLEYLIETFFKIANFRACGSLQRVRAIASPVLVQLHSFGKMELLKSRIYFLLLFCSFFLEGLSKCPNNVFEQQYPQFQIIAAAKTGSTSLYSYLCQHHSIECLAKKKETNLLRSREYYSEMTR